MEGFDFFCSDSSILNFSKIQRAQPRFVESFVFRFLFVLLFSESKLDFHDVGLLRQLSARSN